MATEKQIAANRQNAKRSTGPRTDFGKRRARRNAMRHGLTAETVIDVLEDPVAYKALQRAIYADYRPRSNFELQLIGRLVSLLWRLRRATAIESGMLAIHATAHRKRGAQIKNNIDPEKLKPFYELIPTLAPRAQTGFKLQNLVGKECVKKPLPHREGNCFDIAQSFMRIYQRDGNVLDDSAVMK
jgi:hypothetical protein